ncbi:MAG: hypothetical protein J6B93_00740 [Clostridia bacterium]|nr:hypothetical protein [Clostridia bacterium]
MDTFFEQIVRMKFSGKNIAAMVGILLADLILTFVIIFIVAGFVGLPFAMLLLFGLMWGSYKLLMMNSIEYEYIFTNGDLDIDKIIAKSSRKRVVSVKCASAEKYAKYHPGMTAPGSVKKTYIFCDERDENAVYMIVPHKDEGNVMIVFAPEDRVRTAIEKVIPRIAM